jgi:hypothetical protein
VVLLAVTHVLEVQLLIDLVKEHIAMKAINRRPRLTRAVFALSTLFLMIPSGASAEEFYPAYTKAKVIGHLAFSGSLPRQMFLQEAGNKRYLYLQGTSKEGYAIVDVTTPSNPKIVSQVPNENLTSVRSGLAIVETRRNSGSGGVPQIASAEDSFGSSGASESVRLLDISDPARPRTVRTFSGVTNILADDANGLTYVADSDGIWIVSQRQVLRKNDCTSSDAISGMPNCN